MRLRGRFSSMNGMIGVLSLRGAFRGIQVCFRGGRGGRRMKSGRIRSLYVDRLGVLRYMINCILRLIVFPMS